MGAISVTELGIAQQERDFAMRSYVLIIVFDRQENATQICFGREEERKNALVLITSTGFLFQLLHDKDRFAQPFIYTRPLLLLLFTASRAFSKANLLFSSFSDANTFRVRCGPVIACRARLRLLLAIFCT